TLVPIWLSPGGTVVVAEMSQPAGSVVSSATTPWYLAAGVCAALMLGAIGMVAASSRQRTPAPVPVQVYPAMQPAPAASRGTARPREPQPSSQPQPSAFDAHRVEDAERSRRSAESRADAAEQNLHGIQKQLAEALEANRALEARLVTAQ